MATDAVSDDPHAVLALPPEAISSIEFPYIDYDSMVTEDDTPVDSVFSEKQQRLLTESLHTSWPGPGEGRPYVAMANVGLFFAVGRPPVVPDVLLSLNVSLPADVRPKSARSYFTWLYGKAPDVVVEVVSNREGGEDGEKLTKYAEIGVRYYVIFDPDLLLGDEMVRTYRLHGISFENVPPHAWMPDVGLGLRLWEGRYEDMDATWLRWVDAHGNLVPTGKERAEAERQRADIERRNAESANKRAERLAEQLRQLGVEPLGP